MLPTLPPLLDGAGAAQVRRRIRLSLTKRAQKIQGMWSKWSVCKICEHGSAEVSAAYSNIAEIKTLKLLGLLNEQSAQGDNSFICE